MATTTEQKYLEAQGVPPPEAYSGAPGAVPGPFPGSAVDVRPVKSLKKLSDAYILGIALGWMGAHHFYLGRVCFGVMYLFTFGLFGVGWVVDWFRMPCLVKEVNRRRENPSLPQRKLLSDAYVAWLPCGLFGFHHFYLRRWGWGFVYLFTVGLFGIGWIIDLFRMKHLVDKANEKLEHGDLQPRGSKSLDTAYMLGLCPVTGLLGVHQYYLGRWRFGLGYTFTLGFLGVGYLVDWVRMSFLVKDVNRKLVEGDDGKKRLDDAYVLLIPLGFLGLHHFFLRRIGWGCLYFFTFGLFGIGWLVDFVRVVFLVRDFNREVDEKRRKTQDGANVAGVINPCGPAVTDGYNSGMLPPGIYPGQVMGNPADGTLPPQYPPQGGYYPGPPPQMHQYPHDYGATGQSSWSTIDSSDVDGPPSYQQALSDPEGRIDAKGNMSVPPPQAPAYQPQPPPSAPNKDKK